VEAEWKAMEQRGSVVRQDKSSVVPHREPRFFLRRLTPFSHHARTIFTDHTTWSVPWRMVHAAGASPRLAKLRRTRFAAPHTAIGAAALGVGFLVLSARLFHLRITLTDSSAAGTRDSARAWTAIEREQWTEIDRALERRADADRVVSYEHFEAHSEGAKVRAEHEIERLQFLEN